MAPEALYPHDEDFALDGTHGVKPTPFDALEQATRGEHVPTTENSPDKTKVLQYPKAVDHVDHPSGVGQEPVVVNSPAEEKEYAAAAAAEQKQPDPKAE